MIAISDCFPDSCLSGKQSEMAQWGILRTNLIGLIFVYAKWWMSVKKSAQVPFDKFGLNLDLRFSLYSESLQ